MSTRAGSLGCKHIIHTAFPRAEQYKPKVHSHLLSAAIINTLEEGKQTKVHSLSIPILQEDRNPNYQEEFLEIILQTTIKWIGLGECGTLQEILFCHSDVDVVESI